MEVIERISQTNSLVFILADGPPQKFAPDRVEVNLKKKINKQMQRKGNGRPTREGKESKSKTGKRVK